MQVVSMPNTRTGSQHHYRIAVDIGQYHFVDWRGWKCEWITETPREWWAKQQWLKSGGHANENKNDH